MKNMTHTAQIKSNNAVLHAMPHFSINCATALKRLQERSTMTPDQLIELLEDGRSVWLNNPDKHWENRGYILVYSVADNAFLIPIVAKEKHNSAVMVTVLTKVQYETDKGLIPESTLRRAFNSATGGTQSFECVGLSPSSAAAKRANRMAQKEAQKAKWFDEQFAIILDYRVGSGVITRKHLFNPPGQDSESVRSDPQSIIDQPGFWDWFGQVTTEKSIAVESVLVIKVKAPGVCPMALNLTGETPAEPINPRSWIPATVRRILEGFVTT